LKEIIQTEEEYTKCLQHIIKYFQEPMIKKKLIKESQIPNYFSNLGEIINIHSTFLAKLHQSMDHFPITNFGLLMKEQVPTFFAYISFCNKFDETLELIEKSIKNVKEFECTPEGFTFQSLWIQPIQRLPRYSLLLKELIKFTPEDHLDFQNFIISKEKLDSILITINDSKRKYEMANTMNRIQQYTSDLDFFSIDFTKYLMEDLADVSFSKLKSEFSEEKECLLFLFNDLLLIFEKTKKPKRLSFGFVSSKSGAKKIHHDKKNDIYIGFRNYFHLSESKVVQFKKKVIGMECFDFNLREVIKVNILIREVPGTNSCSVWHENLLQCIDDCDRENPSMEKKSSFFEF
jgi:hypothetical protein